MGIALSLSTLALRPVAEGAAKLAAGGVGAIAASSAIDYLTERFTDQSDRLVTALARANERAWRTLEVALAGDSFWQRCGDLFRPGEEKGFRDQVRTWLAGGPETAAPAFRDACLAELRAARRAGLLDSETLDAAALARRAGPFARHDSPTLLLDAEREALEEIAHPLRKAGHDHQARLVTLKPSGSDTALLALAARYFFRRAVEEDPKLFQGLAFDRLEAMATVQEEGFAALHRLLTEQGQQLGTLLGEVAATVGQTHAAVLDIQEELREQGRQNGDIYRAVMDLQRRFDLMQTEVRPRDSLSIRSPAERERVKEIVHAYRSLPEDRRRELPALLNAIGKLEVATGNFQAAERDFATVAALTDDPQARGEAHMNAFWAALERRDWEAGLRELLAAVQIDSRKFAPFPLGKYQPQRVIGAGGFGVAFLCKHKELQANVVVKTFRGDEIERSVDEVFGEARALWQLDHPGIIRLVDCGYTLPAQKARPYMVMHYFEGLSLEAHFLQNGPLSPEEMREVARQTAEALQAAHEKGIYHRDVKPGNILVRRTPAGRWQVKLIDFGLALRQQALRSTIEASETLAGQSIAGTLDYAAPEQIGKLPGATVGAASDVYSFGKTCYFALLGTPEPDDGEKETLPDGWRKLLSQCTSRTPANRPPTFEAVLGRLDSLGGGGRKLIPAPVEAEDEEEEFDLTPAEEPLEPAVASAAAPAPLAAPKAAPTAPTVAAKKLDSDTALGCLVLSLFLAIGMRALGGSALGWDLGSWWWWLGGGLAVAAIFVGAHEHEALLGGIILGALFGLGLYGFGSFYFDLSPWYYWVGGGTAFMVGLICIGILSDQESLKKMTPSGPQSTDKTG